MRKAEIVKQNLEYARNTVAELEDELKTAEEFERRVAEEVGTYVEKFNKERETALNPFQL
jgi:molecular chaperone GrpE (heat shock protein)